MESGRTESVHLNILELKAGYMYSIDFAHAQQCNRRAEAWLVDGRGAPSRELVVEVRGTKSSTYNSVQLRYFCKYFSCKLFQRDVPFV